MAAPRQHSSIPNVSARLPSLQHVSALTRQKRDRSSSLITLLTEWRFFGGTCDQSGAGADPQHRHHLRVQLPPARTQRLRLHQRANSHQQRREGGAGIRPAYYLQPIREAHTDQLIRQKILSRNRKRLTKLAKRHLLFPWKQCEGHPSVQRLL